MDLSTIWYWMNERQHIRNRRYGGSPWPWTKDPILKEFRFCEVFREDDKVSKWIIDNWLTPYKEHPNLWIACCIARQINWPETLEEIGFPDFKVNYSEWIKWRDAATNIMLQRQRKGLKLYTSAYMIYGGPGKKGGVPEKAVWTMHYVIDRVVHQRYHFDKYFNEIDPLSRSFKYVTKSLEHFPGWSGFMGDQAACDMSYTHLLNQATDLMSWCNPGPGCIRGLNRLYGRALSFNLKEEQAVDEMRELLKIANSSDSPLGNHIQKPLKIHTIESALCETDKYLRVKLGEGRPRCNYSPAR